MLDEETGRSDKINQQPFTTPAVIVEGKLVHKGRLLDNTEIKAWLK